MQLYYIKRELKKFSLAAHMQFLGILMSFEDYRNSNIVFVNSLFIAWSYTAASHSALLFKIFESTRILLCSFSLVTFEFT